jgi:hypothetical protein
MRRSAPRSGRRSCEYCGTPLHERVWRHQSKRCPGYSDLWAMDTYVCFGENLKAHGGEAVLFSVTAPGSDQLPWDESACTVAGEHEHSGSWAVRSKRAKHFYGTSPRSIVSLLRNARRNGEPTLRFAGSAPSARSASASPGGNFRSAAFCTPTSFCRWRR